MTSQATRRPPLKAVVGSSVQHQVAFCGPLGVGKTTAVHAASTTPVSGTEVRSSVLGADAVRPGARMKRTTTVGIEYGEWHRDDGPPVALYGTPGQNRFSHAREGALAGRPAVVLWLFGQNGYALEEAEEWLEYIGRDGGWDRLTVAVTRLDEPGEHPTLHDYRPLLDRFHPEIALLDADPRDPESVRRVVSAALRTTPAPEGVA